MSARTLREIRRHLLIYSGLAPFVVIALFPVVWMAITAFKEEADLYRMDLVPFWFHLPPTLKNFEILFSMTSFGTGVVNTALLGACVVVITLVTAAPASYALARLRLPGAQNLGVTIFSRSREWSARSGFSTPGGRSSSSTRPSPSRSARGS